MTSHRHRQAIALRRLLHRRPQMATIDSVRFAAVAGIRHAAVPHAPSRNSRNDQRMRTFRSPSGREWTVQMFPPSAPGASASSDVDPGYTALRFQSGALVLDVRRFPSDWEALSDGELVELLRRAQPPALGLAGTDARRGRDDGASA
jgi:hypothetical protein